MGLPLGAEGIGIEDSKLELPLREVPHKQRFAPPTTLAF